MAEGRHFGEYDRGHAWHDAGWWHDRYPGWMYSHHPEWAVEQRDWWFYDHQAHPDWFWAPFWESHPVWTWSAPYGGVYHDYWWWHQYHPDWMYAHHPEWAEPYGRWMRDDYGRHPGWFRSNYWRDHPRDWAHPDKEFWGREDGRFKNYLHEHPENKDRDRREQAGKTRGNEQGDHGHGQKGEPRPSGERHPNEASRGPTQPSHPAEHPAPQPAPRLAPRLAPQPAPHPAAGGAGKRK
jgi:hypothetical protein